jgi:ABC-type uncharacterized transport system permease subunit
VYHQFVALSVSGFGCSIAGAVFAIGKNKKNENNDAKVEVTVRSKEY